MKIYVVTVGDYSDYKVCGVYSTTEKAEYAKKLFASDNDLLEMKLDMLPEHQPGMLGFEVCMDRDGTVKSCMNASVIEANFYNEWGITKVSRDGPTTFYVLARDEKHAIKITNEKRTQSIAMEGITKSNP